jgi:PKD repeat protein
MRHFTSARMKKGVGVVAIAAAALLLGGCPKPKPPTASFTFSPSNPVAGDTVAFQSSTGGAFPGPTYSWTFGDDTTSTSSSPTHIYSAGGTYGVTLTETNSRGSSSATESVPVSPGTAPSVSFSFAPSNPTAGRVVSFTNGSTGRPEPTYFWSFGDGATSTATNPTHVYSAPNTYSVRLNATNSAGSRSVTQAVRVSPGAPLAAFTFTPSAPVVGQLVTFEDASDQGPTSWSWDFGDGATSTAQNPTHTYSAAKTYIVRLSAANSYGSNSVTKSLAVAATAPSASFSFTPSNPVTGQPVTFTDESIGGPTAWSWSFGDGATSNSENPTHTYSAANTFNVTLTAKNSRGSSSVTKSVTVTLQTRSVTLSVAGHVVGSGGILFVTDVEIENPNTVPVTADLLFFPAGGNSSSQVSMTLSPLQTLSLPDVVATQFGVTNLFGNLRLDTQGSPPPRLRLISRTYDQAGNGTFGTSISGFVGPAGSQAPRFVTGLQQNGEYRSALGAVNASGEGENFQVLVQGPDGSILGTSPPVSLEPNEQWQIGVSTLFPSVSGVGLTAKFQPMPGSNVPFAYGTLADNLSGDLSYFPSILPATTLYLPVMSKITGRGGALYQGELAVSNASDSSNTVTLTFFEHDRDNASDAKTATVVLAERETRLIQDALALFGLSETNGAVKIESTSPVVVTERINTASATTAGVVGQEVEPILPDRFYSQASILGLRQDDTFRSNISFFNPNASSATVMLTLRRSSGEVLSTATVNLLPLDFTEFSLTGLFPGISFPPGERLTIALDAGSSAIAAYGSIADNISRDLTASPGLR